MGIVPGMLFSILDVKSGFFHVMLDPDSRKFTGFSLPFGIYEFLRLPMGVSCAPEAFQSMMHHLLGHLSFVRIYIDDILVMSRNMDEHLLHLRQVFQILSDNCIRLNKKCEIAKKEIKYLGFILNSEGLQPDPAKVDDLLKLPRPKTRRQVRSVLGALNFFRRFIPQLSSILQPLTRLTSEKVEFQWTTIEEAALIQATESLAKASLLVYPDFQQAFHIMTDASDYGIGGVVFQIKNYIPQPIYFYSRKLSESQICQSIVEKEILAIKLICEHLHTMLFGHKIIIYCDNVNIKYLNSIKGMTLQRYIARIQEYNPEFRHIKGTDNPVADLLSRYYESEPHPEMLEISNIDLPLSIEIIKEQIYIPDSLQNEVISWVHESYLHPGETRTNNILNSICFWPKMRQQIKSHVNKCLICKKSKKNALQYCKLKPTDIHNNISDIHNNISPFEIIAVDLQGPFPSSDDPEYEEFKYLLTIIDISSRWCELIPLQNQLASTVSQAIDDWWLNRYPRPLVMLSDQGANLKSKEISDLCASYGIRHTFTTTYMATANSICERMHGTINNMIRCTGVNDWARNSQSIAFSLRAAFHSSLGKSPSEVIFNLNMLMPLYNSLGHIHKTTPTQVSKDVARLNKNRIAHLFKVNDLVFIRKTERDLTSKWDPQQEGPFKITHVHLNNTITVDRHGVPERLNIRRLIPWSAS
eukprot:NODE_800_length_3823_cov_0.427766.p1 type:complete len:698 gc:universal NODE_800_length_3823_cov_0.427766:2156-63(-)